jgi:hypothetical protein
MTTTTTDTRQRCETLHLVCEDCGRCACDEVRDLVAEYPSGRVRVVTDKQGRTLCFNCRYERDELGGF